MLVKIIKCSKTLIPQPDEHGFIDRYQVLAGVIEQRMLEPLLHKHKLVLSAICFAVRTGNTYLGSLL